MPFHIVSIGWNGTLIEGMLDRVEANSDIRFSHIIVADRDLESLTGDRKRSDIFRLATFQKGELSPGDPAFLASLEVPGVPTIHSMIMGDRVLKHVPYDEALAYATFVACGLVDRIGTLYPSAVLGGFDGIHSALGLAVARRLGIPWFAMTFTSIPPGLTAFCTGLTPDTAVQVEDPNEPALRELAQTSQLAFERRETTVPAYRSANSVRLVAKRLPTHVRTLASSVRRMFTSRLDHYSEYSVARLCRDYVRKRKNLVRLPRAWFYNEPPATPFVYFGLHMQPESSIDVWAPFFSDQFAVIEMLARSIPPSHQLLVKLHHSDADNYSRTQLDRIRRLPGVKLVSPFASSRPFVDAAALIVAIQGTVALEAALVGKPVLKFGASRMLLLPSVTRVGALTDIPRQIREKLSEPPPDREQIIQGYMSYLRPFAAGCYSNWDVAISDDSIRNLVRLFGALQRYVVREQIVA